MVRSVGLEPTRLSTHAPQTCLSTDSSMTAHMVILLYIKNIVKRKNKYHRSVEKNMILIDFFVNLL